MKNSLMFILIYGRTLRQNQLDHTAIIATTLPFSLRTDVQEEDEETN